MPKAYNIVVFENIEIFEEDICWQDPKQIAKKQNRGPI